MNEPEKIGPKLLTTATQPDPKVERKRLLDAWQDEERTRQETEAEERRIKALGIPPFYADATFDSFEADTPERLRLLEFARKYVADWPGSPLLTLFRGNFRTGKGHLAWSIVKAVGIEKRKSCRVVKLADMVRDLRTPWREGSGESEETRLNRYRNYALLVIDEVSKHAFYGQSIHQHLYDVLDHRLEQCRPTILTSNEENGSLADVLQGALWYRLNENGGIIDFGQDSYRRKKA